MVLTISFDTATYYAGVGLSLDGAVTERIWRSKNNHGVELMTHAEALLNDAGRTFRDIDRVAVAIGPGRFTALRVGISTAKGVCSVRGLPLVGISTFELMAMDHWKAPGPLVVAVDAGSSGVAWAHYPRPSEFPVPVAEARAGVGVAMPKDLVARFGTGARFCGEGAGRLRGLVDDGRIMGGEGPARRPWHLLELSTPRFEAGDTDDPARLVPFYVRQPTIARSNGPGSE
ncbi:MAG: tRNA (adenosine(37)-N6)-threonylcarbamoyltransferase complex dimerization subunit type 1 TsaB [SAR202 cluster bacterium]|nr:tRNA (adenosine(37)-N6)-threonylcarbamoyltransferase complex dimerization subunit type 1 TsaB [SAR202 cluster bacterium]